MNNHVNFYPRSPCGERRQIKQTRRAETSISIHALLAESDVDGSKSSIKEVSFLSTLSLRRATNDAINGCNPDFISIHALLAESDTDMAKRFIEFRISIHALLAESDQ